MKCKKAAALLAISLLGISLLTGCGGNKEENIVSEEDGIEEDLAETGEVTVALDQEDSGNEAESEEEEVLTEDEEEAAADPDVLSESSVIDEENNIEFIFEANQQDVGELPDKAEMSQSAGDLDNARWESLKIYYEGNETDAQEELDELRSTAALSSDILKKIEPYYPEIARYFAKAGITSYDMTKPFYTDEEEVDFDVYTDKYVTYYLTVYFGEGGKIESFEMIEENASSEDDIIELDDDADSEEGDVIDDETDNEPDEEEDLSDEEEGSLEIQPAD